MSRTITICGIPHTIIETEDIFNTGDTHLGQINYCKAEIMINKNMSDEMKMETLCHEVVHGMLMLIGRDQLAEDESFVQALGNAIHQTFGLKWEG